HGGFHANRRASARESRKTRISDSASTGEVTRWIGAPTYRPFGPCDQVASFCARGIGHTPRMGRLTNVLHFRINPRPDGSRSSNPTGGPHDSPALGKIRGTSPPFRSTLWRVSFPTGQA